MYCHMTKEIADEDIIWPGCLKLSRPSSVSMLDPDDHLTIGINFSTCSVTRQCEDNIVHQWLTIVSHLVTLGTKNVYWVF